MKSKFLLTILMILLTLSSVQAAPNFNLIYVIQEGDTLSDIADAYNVSMTKIKNENNISKDNWIKAGQEILIPLKDNQNENIWDSQFSNLDRQKSTNISLDTSNNYSIRINKNQNLPEVNIPRSQLITYHIGRGDTLFELARNFNTSIGIIMALNNMENSSIRIGDKLLLPINNLSAHQILAKTIKPFELELLAKAINGEARGETFTGQIAVGAVIINRVLSSYFPDTITEVIYQPNQFSAVTDGQINLKPTRTSYLAAKKAVQGTDPTLGALYFYNPRTAQNKRWFATRRTIVTIGKHEFTR